MNRIVLIVVGLALVLGVVFTLAKKKSGSGPEMPTGETRPAETHPAEEPANPEGSAPSATGKGPSNGAGSKPGQAPGTGVSAPSGAGTAPGVSSPNGQPGGVSGQPGGVSGQPGQPGQPSQPGTSGETGVTGGRVETPKPHAKETPDGVDGNIGKVSQPGEGDDGEGAPAPKPTTAPSLAGVKSPRVWLVAADLKKLPGAKSGSFEVGNAEGSRATPWKNRSGGKSGDGVRAKGGTTATFVRNLKTTHGEFDGVAFCPPATSPCVNSAPSQIKIGLDINHPESWVNGPDASGKSAKGGGSFTALFVAARGSKAANPLMENQNGEAGAKQGPFLGWIGADLVGSIHGLQGIVGLTAVAVPSPWRDGAGIAPAIYTLRFDRKKADLRIFQISDQGASTQAQDLAKGDGPDNDQYAAIAIGSKNPDKGSVTYVFEAATFSRSLADSEICAIHKDWNKRYSLGIPASQLKPCR